MDIGMELKSITIHLGFIEIEFEANELKRTLQSLINEMRSIIATVTEKERETLRHIMECEDEELTVSLVFPDFERGTEEHATLQKLRDAQFIRPLEGGRWQAEKHIEIKQFGRLMWDKIGENELFAKPE